ncbi:MAG: DUF58 domain-containing protein [Lachnospiraceae bacterium]|nr:DUF58 domain-containing protein [Lachnospiraceae bacterium]
MEIDYEYLARISKDAVLYTSRKTTNILDGGYNSVYLGKSHEFQDLKEYSQGDDITSIDWKASSRNDRLLVRRYIAEKKHSVLIIGDTGAKMDADTSLGESKANIALMSLGVIGYLLGRQGSDVGFACSGSGGIVNTPFRSGGICVEELLRSYGASIFDNPATDIDGLIMNMLRSFPTRRLLVFVITDLAGLKSVRNSTLSRLTEKNDAYFICVDDASLTGGRVYDRVGEEYVDRFLAGSRSLRKAEEAERNNILSSFKKNALRNRVVFDRVASEANVVDTVLNLFERGRSGIFG